MQVKEVIRLGWTPFKKSESDGLSRYKLDEYIMSIAFNYENDFHLVLIMDSEGVKSNQWESSETLFYGMIKTEQDLSDVMRFVGIIDYELLTKKEQQ